jgi:hypothetical protein
MANVRLAANEGEEGGMLDLGSPVEELRESGIEQRREQDSCAYVCVEATPRMWSCGLITCRLNELANNSMYS